LIDYVPE